MSERIAHLARALRWALGAVGFSMLLAACGTDTAAVRQQQQGAASDPAATRPSLLPPVPQGTLRLYIYRPQYFVGNWGRAIVIVNGRWFGNPQDPVQDNRMIPGSVFVVDVPQGKARVTWTQPGRPEGTDPALELSAATAPVAYLRWTLKPTYGHLEPVAEAQAAQEIAALRFTGHITLITP